MSGALAEDGLVGGCIIPLFKSLPPYLVLCPFPFPSEPRGGEYRVSVYDSPVYDPEAGWNTEFPGGLNSRPFLYGFGKIGFQEVLKMGGLSGKGCMMPKFPVAPGSFPNPVQSGGLSAVQSLSSAKCKKALRQGCLGWGIGVVPQEPEDAWNGRYGRLGCAQFPRQYRPSNRPYVPSCRLGSELPEVATEPDVVAQVSRCKDWKSGF
jgi:hypothetical protein